MKCLPAVIAGAAVFPNPAGAEDADTPKENIDGYVAPASVDCDSFF